MPKRIHRQELDKIAALLAPHKAGLAIVELEQACKTESLDFDRRTLQRRIAELIRLGRIFKKGEGRASRYLLAPITSRAQVVMEPIGAVARAEAYVPLSPPATEVKNLVRRPITERKPVGYNRAFLERYQPNRSFYLPDSMRSRLHALGHSPAAKHAAGTYARDILNRLMIDLSWSSSRLEGNTYSRLETQNLIEFGHAADGKDQREAQMILNHKAAIEMLVNNAGEIGFDTFTFFNLHALLSENLLMDPDASGRLRTTIVEIGGSVFHPMAVPQQIEDYFRLILDKTNAIRDPFEQAFFLMVHIPYLQPFLDVNKRVSRLGANIPLIKHNLSPLSFVDVPEQAYVDGALGVYEFNRVELLRDVFLWAYERSCQRYVAIKDSLPEPDPLRLRNREALISVVSEIVRGGKPIDTRLIRELAAPLVKPDDLGQFVAMAFNDLHHLHEGNITRYRLRLSEYRSWKQSPEALEPGHWGTHMQHDTNNLGQPVGFVVADWKPPPALSGEPMEGRFCRLERLDPDVHASSLYSANALDAEGRMWTYLSYGPFVTFESYRAWMDNTCRGSDPLFYAIIDSKSNKAAGVASYKRINPGNGSVEVGHLAYSPLLQRTPVSTEAMYLMMERAFSLGYRRYEWNCNALNARSWAAAQRLGLSFEGVFRQAAIVRGRNRDTAWFAAIDTEWPALRDAFLRWFSPDNFDEQGKQKIRLSALTGPILKQRG